MIGKSAISALTAAIAMLVAAPPARSAQPTEPLQPSSRWRVDYADSECRLMREFGTGENAITLRIVRRDASDTFDSIIAGPGIPNLPRQVDVTVTLQPQGAEQRLKGYSFALPKATSRYISWNDASTELLEQFQPDQTVRFAADERFAVRLQLTEARVALTALEACYTDLLTGWGVDPTTVIGVAKSPRAIGGGSTTVTAMRAGAPRSNGPTSWVSWTDYPTEALRQEIGGTVVMALTVGTNGRINACRVISSSKSSLLDQRTCELLTLRARYEPGRDASGKAVPATTILRVRWNIPPD